MFTGLIQDVGTLVDVTEIQEGRVFNIQTKLTAEISIGDSIAVNGCCLTVTHLNNEKTFGIMTVQAVQVTLEKTTLSHLVHGSQVNLELALRLSDRLGGHLVQGHINCTALLVDSFERGDNYNLWFEIPKDQMKYIMPEGSITLSGISLTIADRNENRIMVTIIPHTWHHTNLRYLKLGDAVNVEVDMMAKYLENFMKYQDKGLRNEI